MRGWRRAVTLAVVGLVALPGVIAAAGDESDGYPLSTYPMFARERPAETVLHAALVVGPGGAERRLTPHDITGSNEPLQATTLVGRALATDPGPLCRSILDRVALDAAQRVVLVAEGVNAVEHYSAGAEARRVATHECEGER